MITLSDAQKSKAFQATPKTVTLVRIETYTDHDAGTVDETLYFATVPLLYRWNGSTVNQFQGFVKGVSPIARGFVHVPDDEDLSTRDGINVTFESGDWAGQNLWNRVRSSNLIGATIEVASFLIDWQTAADGTWIDQSTATADHIVRFSGEITTLPPYEEDATTFTITADSTEPVLPWPSALDETETSEQDLGKRYPMPVGRPKRVPLIQRQVGWFTTISADLTETTTGTIQVTDTAGLPAAGTFGIWIGTERLTASVVNATSISIVARGTTVDGLATTARIHNAGSVLIEELEVARFVFSGVPILGMTSLYARSPHTGELVLIPKGLYGFATQDESLDTGEKLGVVSFTQKLWGQLIQLLNNEAKVTVQPAQSGVDTVFVQFGSKGVDTSHSNAVNCDLVVNFQNGHTFDEDPTGPGNTDASEFTMDSAVIPSQSRTVSRYRVIFDYRIETDASNPTTIYYDWDGNVFGDAQGKTLLQSLAGGSATQYNTKASAWNTPAGGTTLADLIGGKVYVYMDNSAGGTSAQTEISIYTSSRFEVELEPLAIDTATETSGAQEIGFNLDLFADVLGAVNLGTETALTNFDEIAQTTNSWVGVGCTLTDTLGGGVSSAGSGTATVRTLALLNQSPVLNFDAARLRFEYNITSGTWDDMTGDRDAFEIMLLSSAGNSVRWEWPKSVLHGDGAWHEFTLEIFGSSPQVQEQLGTIDASNIVQINIDWETTSPTALGIIHIRNLRSEARSFPEHPIDVATWLIEDVAGVTADTTTLATARTNLPSVTVSGDLKSAGTTLAELLARIGYNARTNFVFAPNGAKIKAFNALATYAFTAKVRTITEYEGLKAFPRELAELPTEFLALYEFRSDLNAGTVDGYRSMLQANATTNDISADVPTSDITDAQALFGTRSSDPLPFTLLDDSVSTIEVFAYYVAEALRSTALRFSMRVSYPMGYDLEAGDIVDFVPPWQAGVIKCRVLSVVFPFDSPSIDLGLEEVL